MSRFLGLFGGFTDCTGSYSAGAALYAVPYVLGHGAWGIDPATLQHSRLIILWGLNVVDCRFGSELLGRLRQARAAGTEIIVVDPRRSRTARLLASRYGVEDEEVLAVARWHSTGRAGMSALEKVLFLADKVEPGKAAGRPDLEEVRRLAETDLDGAVLRYLDLQDLAATVIRVVRDLPVAAGVDFHVEVPPVEYRELAADRSGEPSECIRERVERASGRQHARFKDEGFFTNARMDVRHVRKHCRLDGDGQMLLRQAIDSLGLSARAYNKILKVARTIADIEGTDDIKPHHVSEAINYRTLDRALE
jgi:hypothetical protein